MPLGDHLEELRKRLIWALLGLVPFLVIGIVIGRWVLDFMTIPVRRALADAGLPPVLQATSPIEVFGAYMKVAMILTILGGSWWVLIQLWKFISPGLYISERRFVYILVPMSFSLTVIGVVFMYYAMLPVVLAFFIDFGSKLGAEDSITRAKIVEVAPEVMDAMPTIPVLAGDPAEPAIGQTWINSTLMQQRMYIETPAGERVVVGTPLQLMGGGVVQQYRLSEYIKLVLTFALGFAIGFQMPVVVLLLGWAGIIDHKSLAGYRRYILMGCLVVGAVLTPADPISMMLLGGPLYLLFEFGLVLQRVMPASKVADGFRSKKSDSESGSAS
ncbi:MAG: twin-arginine translocase subunit TatC [Phycisphaerales bacterium]|nr:twin-arginine translocase subunit TatC [Phycisphaerales bacterium]MCB9835818.1 twin-arginine translocase subunit TatC [Phycisphaera sp.]